MFGGNITLFGDQSHFALDTMSVIAGTAIEQEAAMDPNITVGTRKLLTDLDYAALVDVGWEIPVEIIRSADMDGSGALDAFDVAGFELALADPQAFISPYPGASVNMLADVNGSGVLDAFDVSAFEQLLAGGAAVAVPSPHALALLVWPGVSWLHRRRRRGA